MKTLRLIYMAVAAIFLVASCDDDSMNLDKAHIDEGCSYNLRVDIGVNDTTLLVGYYPRWDEPKFETTQGRAAIMNGGLGQDYEVYVWNGQKGSAPVLVNSEILKDEINGGYCTWVGLNDVKATLGTSENFLFGVKAAKMPGGNDTSSIEFQTQYEVCIVVDGLSGKGGSVELESPSLTVPPIGFSYGQSDIDAYIYRWEYITKVDGVKLTAMANLGYKFDHWSDGSTENPRNLDVSGNTFLEAVFVPLEEEIEGYYKINVRVAPSAECGTVEGVGRYEENEIAQLTAKPNNGYTFAGWYHSDYSPVLDDRGKAITDPSYSFNVKNDVDWVAYFTKTEGYIPFGVNSDNFLYNEWFIGGIIDVGATIENGITKIPIVRGIDKPWDIQYCNVFNLGEGQEEGNIFELSFSVKWEGTDSKTAAFRILPDFDINYGGIGNDSPSDYQITSPSAELIFDNNTNNKWPTSQNEAINLFQYAGEEWTPITWGGEIGSKGEYIGIHIDLGGDFSNLNGEGTFLFKEINVKITDKNTNVVYNYIIQP